VHRLGKSGSETLIAGIVVTVTSGARGLGVEGWWRDRNASALWCLPARRRVRCVLGWVYVGLRQVELLVCTRSHDGQVAPLCWVFVREEVCHLGFVVPHDPSALVAPFSHDVVHHARPSSLSPAFRRLKRAVVGKHGDAVSFLKFFRHT
jgi:hypothetical protein